MPTADLRPLLAVAALFLVKTGIFVITWLLISDVLIEFLAYRNFVYAYMFDAGILVVNGLAYYAARRQMLRKRLVQAHISLLAISLLFLPLVVLSLPFLNMAFNLQLPYPVYRQGFLYQNIFRWITLAAAHAFLLYNLFLSKQQPATERTLLDRD